MAFASGTSLAIVMPTSNGQTTSLYSYLNSSLHAIFFFGGFGERDGEKKKKRGGAAVGVISVVFLLLLFFAIALCDLLFLGLLTDVYLTAL